MTSILTLLAGLGIGSFLGAYLNLNWSKRRFVYEVKLKLYSNFILCYQKAAANSSDKELQQDVVASLKNLELISNEQIIKESENFYKGGGTGVRDKIIQHMRQDLIETLKLN